MVRRKSKLAATDIACGEPVYQQLAKLLRRQILSGQLPVGTKLPERWIAEQYQVTRTTVRSTLYLLAVQGLIRRLPRKGTVVADVRVGESPFSSTPAILVKQGWLYQPRPDDPQDWHSRIHAGIQAMAQEMGYEVKRDVVANPMRIPLSHYVPPQPTEAGGVIVCGIYDEQYIDMFRSERIPLVAVDYWTLDLTTDCVTVDVESEAYEIVDLLAQRGHTSLGFLGQGRPARGGRFHEYDPDIHRMLDSLRRATQRRRLEFRNEWVLLVPTLSQLQLAVRGYFSMRPRPTAVVCFQEHVTAAVLRTLADLSLRCPEDVSVINRATEYAAGRHVTSTLMDPELLGRFAVKLLAERMHGLRTNPVKLALPPRLVLGDTTGPASRDR